MLERLLEYEREWFFTINGMHTWWLDYIMLAFASMWAWFPLIVVPLWFFIKRREEWVLTFAFTILTAIITILVTEFFVKPLCVRFRPTNHPLFMDNVRILNNYIADGIYGFISGHSANALAFAVMSAFIIKNKYYSLTIFSWAAIMVYSRVYLGAHFISDVIPGALAGTVIGWLLYLLYQFIQNRKVKP